MRLAALIVGFVTLAAVHAHAQEPFYKGKRLTIMVNYAAGGLANPHNFVRAAWARCNRNRPNQPAAT